MNDEELAAKQLRAVLDAEVKSINDEKDFAAVMSDAQGRRFMWSLLNEFGVFGQLFNESHATMAYLEGRRQAGLFLMTKINTICPEQYMTMANENTKPPEDDQ